MADKTIAINSDCQKDNSSSTRGKTTENLHTLIKDMVVGPIDHKALAFRDIDQATFELIKDFLQITHF